MDAASVAALAHPQVQAALLGEAVASAEVGVLVWDDDRHFVAANSCACDLLGCTLDQLLGTSVGDHTVDGEETVERVLRGAGGRGRVTVERFDGGTIALEYLTFATRTAGLPYMASIVWPANEPTSA